MNDQFEFKFSSKKIDGQAVPEADFGFPSSASPFELTRKLSETNKFDYDALEQNRAGQLAFSQVLNGVQVIAICLLVIAAAIWLIMNVPAALENLFQTGLFLDGALACFNSILGVAVLFGLAMWGLKIGFQRYIPENVLVFLQRLLIGVDLLLGRVEKYEGQVSKDEAETITTQRNSDGSGPTRTEYTSSYFYLTGHDQFRVSRDAYEAFPSTPITCRLYYLPLSKVMVNIEVL